MEQDIEMLFGNVTSLVKEYEEPLIDVVCEYVELFIILIGTVCNVIIIYLIIRNRRMRSRTNIILLNWCISYMFLSISQLYLFANVITSIREYIWNFRDLENFLSCAYIGIDFVYAMLCAIFMIILITPRLMKSTTVKLNAILGFSYAIASIIYLAQILSCHLLSYYDFILIALIAGSLCITVIIKDVNRCRKKSGIPMSDKSLERLNIAKICVYNLLLAVILEIMIDMLVLWNIVPWSARSAIRMVNFTRHLTSMYICIYLYKNNRQFKMCILNLFKFNSSESYVDATITFDEDSDEENSDNFKANLNINGPV